MQESTTSAPKQLATAEQMAAKYSVDESTIWRWAGSGIIPKPIKISDGCTRFDIEATDRVIAERNAASGTRKTLKAAVAASLVSKKRAKVLAKRRKKAARKQQRPKAARA